MLSFTEFLIEGMNIKVNKKEIEITKPSRAAKDTLVVLDVANFDKAYKSIALKQGFYIGKKGSGGISGRYKRFGLFVMGGKEEIEPGFDIDHEPAKSIEAAEVSVNDKGEIQFTNGRHRYAWLRDNNASKIIVAMDKESVYNARKYKYI